MGSYARFEHYLTTLEVETCPEFCPPSPVSGPLCGATLAGHDWTTRVVTPIMILRVRFEDSCSHPGSCVVIGHNRASTMGFPYDLRCYVKRLRELFPVLTALLSGLLQAPSATSTTPRCSATRARPARSSPAWWAPRPASPPSRWPTCSGCSASPR